MIIDLHYLPSLEYFACLLAHDSITIETQEHYEKQSYRNRCNILASNRVDVLSIPVVKGNSKIKVQDLRIDYSQDWRRRHWGAISSAYGKTPFFEYYADYFRAVYDKKTDLLYEFNAELLTICLKLLRVEKKIIFTEAYQPVVENDYRGQIHPKRPFIFNNVYQPVAYRQNFGNEFAPNLSIIDLLFCQGNQALSILERSVRK